MKLRSLRVHGFKSFADSTDIQFHEGITAIVGPNGCGKSNISDAIRWVLGEQRPTAIRGAKMEEAIFQGSVNRRPVNRGSVTMVVSNEEGTLPVPFEEVEIGRRVYRDGGSDYSINKSVVRLKDVVDLVRDTGLGANAYNVIENRMIDSILSDRADERRALFEEAAGIGKYKDRRKAANRRLERAEVDLQRLEDVIAEVETKVRSLARQKGRAERHIELRKRRLSVEVAVVRFELEILSTRLAELEQELEPQQPGEGMLAEVQAAETRYEALRTRQVDAEKGRAEAAGRVEQIRSELIRWERELAVAAERAGHAERRLSQIDGERNEAEARLRSSAREKETLATQTDNSSADLARVREDLVTSQEHAQAVRDRLVAARAALEALEAEEQGLARRGAQLEGDVEAAGAQAAELARRLERLAAELESADTELGELQAQGDLFSDRAQQLAGQESASRLRAEDAEHELTQLREALEAARGGEMEAGERASALAARHSALESMERDQEGLEPAVQAALALAVPGVHGVLVDFLEAPAQWTRAIETFLGPLSKGIVVENVGIARRLRTWFVSEWGGVGGLVVLALDRAPSRGLAPLPEGLKPVGAGAPWVHALLAGLQLVDEEKVLEGGRGTSSVSQGGIASDASGVLFVGNSQGSTGILERRDRLRTMGVEAEVASQQAREARLRREEVQGEVGRAEVALEQARAAVREAEDQERRARAEVAEQVDKRARVDRHHEELIRQVEGTRAARERAEERASRASRERAELEVKEQELRQARQGARAALVRVQEEWEAARTEESRLTVHAARLEGELARLGERLEAARAGADSAQVRMLALFNEQEMLSGDLAAARAVSAEGEAATRTLFDRRQDAEAEHRERSAHWDEVLEALREAERRVRLTRQAERESSEKRHRLELELQETRGQALRIRERLEVEWGRSLERLLEEAEPLDEDKEPEAAQDALLEIIAQLERIGPVNMLAVEEHEEESRRLAFLKEQHQDLIEARDDLRAAIRRINQTATELFLGTFERIRESYQLVHRQLFEGGEADIWFAEGEDPLESPIEIHASPRGKKTQRIDLLSGGERALTALSLLFAIYLVKPSPFCVLDEVDAPLDDNNIGRFIRLLDEFKKDTQFVVITHNPRTIEAADWIYGVTMEEPGVSTIVGVRLEDALERARGTAA